jgi:hypothetical protein
MTAVWILGVVLAAAGALSGSTDVQAGGNKPGTVPLPVMPIPGPLRSGQTFETWAPRALAYLEALKGQGVLPPRPDHFVVRFRGRRPNARITPTQFRRSLAHCRQTSQHLSASAGLTAEWACTGRGALGRLLVLQLGGYADRITGVVWIDRRPPPLI